MKIRKPGHFAAGLSAAALMLAAPAMAAEKPAPMPQDRAAQVVLTRAEARARAEAGFDKLDVNHDGKLDKADHDARHLARINAHFDALDTNHDGTISREEFVAAHTAPHGPGMEHAMEHGMHPGMDPDTEHGRAEHPMERAMVLFDVLRQADPQHTGSVTRQAFVDAALKLFDEADTNHDGKLTRAEGRAAFRRHHPRMGRHMGPHGGHQHDGHGFGPDGRPGPDADDMPPPPPPPPAHQH